MPIFMRGGVLEPLVQALFELKVFLQEVLESNDDRPDVFTATVAKNLQAFTPLGQLKTIFKSAEVISTKEQTIMI